MAEYIGWKSSLTAALGKIGETLAVRQVALTSNLIYTIPEGTPSGIVHRVVFTQDGTGGHTVTYGPDTLAIDTEPGASTLVEIWPGGSLVYPGGGSGGYPGGGSGGYPLQQVALSGSSHTLTVPAGAPTDQDIAIVLTQPAQGGVAVTLGADITLGAGVTWDVDALPHAETVVVLRPRAAGGWVVEGCWLSVAGVPNTIVVPTAPTFTDLSGTAQDTYTIPSQAGVQYRVGGVVEAAGAHPATGTVTITAEAATGYEIGSGATTSWEFTYTDITTIPVGTPATLAEAISDYGATGYWKLDEASGTTITDYSGNNNHGTLAGTAGTDYTLAAQNGYLEFKTATGKITVPDHNGYSIPADGAITVFMLERRATLGGGRALINKTATNQGEWIMVALWGVVAANLYTPTNQLISAKQSDNIPTAAWCAHWTILRRPSDPMSYPEHYVNSATLSSGAADSGFPSTNYVNGTAPLNIGGGVIGAVGEVAIFPWALTTAHIQKMLDLARAEGLIP